MKFLILSLITLLATACASGGGSSGSAGHVVDHTPHDYSGTVIALTNQAQIHPVTLHQICDFGLPGLRDETNNFSLVAPNVNGGMGCSGVSNMTFEVTNTGTDVIYFSIVVDTTTLPDVAVQPGTTYTFQRGF